MGTDSNEEYTAQVARLYADHHAPLNRFITKKMHQPEEAEDVVQEAFARLINNDSSAARGYRYEPGTSTTLAAAFQLW